MAETEERVECQLVAGMLMELGYRAQRLGSNMISTGLGGLKVLLTVYDDSIQLYCGFSIDEQLVGSEKVNNFNKNFRFSKLYLQDKTSICLEYDYIIDFDGNTAARDLERAMALFEGSLALVRRELGSESSAAGEKAGQEG